MTAVSAGFLKALCEPGDILLYQGTGFFSKLIRIKTWSPYSHIEMYIGGGQSIASRDGEGVGTFPLRTDGAMAVLRPNKPFDLGKALVYHNKSKGQKYDWLGLFRFFTLGKQSTDKQFCSEYITRVLRAGGFEPFTPEIDADLVSPGEFAYSPNFDSMWRNS